MPTANSKLDKGSVAFQIKEYSILAGAKRGDRYVWYIKYAKLMGKENVFITPIAVWYTGAYKTIVIKSLQEAATIFGPALLLKPNDILEQFDEKPTAYGVCDYSDPNHPRTFEVKDEQNLIPSAVLAGEGDKAFALSEYTYQFVIFLANQHTGVINKSETAFFQKYGHADIVLKNQKGATGQGTLEMDGYSIGWKQNLWFQDGIRHMEYTIRGNYPCSSFKESPTFIITVRANFDCELRAYIVSKDPSFETIPTVPINVKANSRADVIFSANKVMNTSEGDTDIEIDPEVHDKPVNNDHLLNVPKTFYRFNAVLESIGRCGDLRIQKNGAIEVKTRSSHPNQKMPTISHKQVWVGLALEDSEKKRGKDYWYLAGGEDEEPDYRIIQKHVSQDQETHKGLVTGYIKALDLHYKVSLTIESDYYDEAGLKVEIQSSNGFTGYLDIISDFKFDFYDDGPIKIDLPPNKLFLFMGC